MISLFGLSFLLFVMFFLRDFIEFCEGFFDDVITFSETIEEHLTHLEKVLNKLAELVCLLILRNVSLQRIQLISLGITLRQGYFSNCSKHTENFRLLLAERRRSFTLFIGMCNPWKPLNSFHTSSITLQNDSFLSEFINLKESESISVEQFKDNLNKMYAIAQ